MEFVDRLFDELNRRQLGDPVDFALSRDEFLAIVNDPGVQAVIKLRLKAKNDPAFKDFLADYLLSAAVAFEQSAALSDENVAGLDWLVEKGLKAAPLAGGGLVVLGVFASGLGAVAGAILIFGGLGAIGLAGIARWDMTRARRRAADAAASIRRFVDGL